MVTRVWRQNRKKAGNVEEQKGGANHKEEGARATVQQQAESSSMGENRGVFGGGFRAGLGDHLAAPEETKPPFPTRPEMISPIDTGQDATQIFNAPSAPDDGTAKPDEIPIDPALLHIDAILSKTGDVKGKLREAEQFLREVASESKCRTRQT
ncbi:hypothetical protein MMC07_000709 [Pseudocyphellaria aurata]|nr:hypothetical protein [Pseudocyphellaria aurata]